MEGFAKCIDEAVIANAQVIHLSVEDPALRKQIHQYVKDKYGSSHISRTEYMAHGTEMECCGVWHKSSNYGESWNGGHIHCNVCYETTYLDYDDCDDIRDDEDVRLSLYRPTKHVMICRKGHPYKTGYRNPFSYRKHY